MKKITTVPPLKITIVTPNYNDGPFIEDTIVSVLSQNYPNLEYILVDGASTDNSMQIVERYSRHFTHIISEKDQGHADALNKGFELATGEILAWINSDDLLLPGSLQSVNEVFGRFKDVRWLTGRPTTADESGLLHPSRPLRMWSWIRFLCGDFRHIQQESTFWRHSLWQEAGARLNTRYQLANDFELWLRFFQRALLYTVDVPLGCFRFRGGQRSVTHAIDYDNECIQALESFVDTIPASLQARYFHLMDSEQLRLRSMKPSFFPLGLAASDPPLITFDTITGDLIMNAQNPPDIPIACRADVSVEEDLIFDGFDRIVWSTGPQFSVCDLTAVEIEIAPFAPGIAVTEGLGEVSPPMVALVGPLALSDWGSGMMILEIRFCDGTVKHELKLTDANRIYRIKVLVVGDRYVLILDGRTIAVEPTKGSQIMQSFWVVLGGGHAQRFWIGTVQRVAVTVLERSRGDSHIQASCTYMLTHKPGIITLPRQRCMRLPPVNFSEAMSKTRPTPLAVFRNRHHRQRCFIMGNGPSLNRMELEKLAGEVVFACNAAFLLFERVSWRPLYYTCVDTRVIRDRAAEITHMLDTYPSITAFFPTVVHLHDGSGTDFSGREIIPPGPNRYYFNEVGNRESHQVETMFSLDADDYVVQPYTVAITMLQLATYMGFSEIFLIGCDTTYKIQESVRQEGQQIEGVGLFLTSTRDDDCNHFDPRYFGQGRAWHNPQVSQMINHYRWAQLAVRRSGTRVFNATVGGQLEIFQRVDFKSLFAPQPNGLLPATFVRQRKLPLLSVAIPAYDRPGPLLHALKVFITQIVGKYEDEIEIVVSDDCSPDDSLQPVRELVRKHQFLRYRRHTTNIGLEQNLLVCAEGCIGEYLWIFGDDDFLETEDALSRIMPLLREGRYDVFILNRTRRNTDLSHLQTPNWLSLEENLSQPYAGLREFCLDFGFISVLGFISTNIVRRRLFQRVDASKYMGTMYPQLGAMVEAFHDRPTLLLGAPLVCQRTLTQEEKRHALGSKVGEADFMADTRCRKALYFSHPHIAMLDELVACGAFKNEDLMHLRENTVIDGHLVDFLIDCLKLSDELSVPVTKEQWARTESFFASLPLSAIQKDRVEQIFANRGSLLIADAPLTISVVTPSFNQAEFLSDCLTSVRDQTYPALEHLVFDPGSTDGSRAIATSFTHVMLFAEPDNGQSDALNKGFTRARGDIVCWLNSDDQLIDHEVFAQVVQRFMKPDAPDIVYGKGIYIDETGTWLREAYINKDPDSLSWRLAQEDGIMQPSLFMRRSVFEQVGPLRDDLHFTMDYEYWIRCVKAGIRFAFVYKNLAAARYHAKNKTYGQREASFAEICRMLKEHFGYVHHLWLRRYAEFLVEGYDGVLTHSGNAGIQHREEFEEKYQELANEYNCEINMSPCHSGKPRLNQARVEHAANRIETVSVILFGTGSMAERALSLIESRGDIQVVACADNDIRKQGTSWHGLPIVSPPGMQDLAWDLILVASSFGGEIVQGLVEMGVDHEFIIVLEPIYIMKGLDDSISRMRQRSAIEAVDVGRSELDWPSVLILSHETLNDSHGTGVLLQRYFSGFPTSTLFSVHQSGVGMSAVPQCYRPPAAMDSSSLTNALREVLTSSGFQPDLIYSTAFNETDLSLLTAVLNAVPIGVPVVHHFLDYAPHDDLKFSARFSLLLNTVSCRHQVWAFTESLATALELRLARPVSVVSALYQTLPAETKTRHRPWSRDFRTVMLGNLWQPHALPIINHIWARCQAVLPGLRPIDWFVHPLRAQALVEAGYDIGDQVVWRGFVPALQERLRSADLAFLPFNVESSAVNGYSRFSLPSRLTELCAAGLPIFALASADTELALFITHHGNGRVADASDEEATVRALANFIRDQPARAEAGMRARETAEREFDLQPFLVNFQDNLRAIASAGGWGMGPCDVQT